MFDGGYTIEVWRGGANQDGDRARTLAGEYPNVGINWGSSSEVNAESGPERSERVVTTAKAVFDVEPDIKSTDRIVVQGITGNFEVNGRVLPTRSPFDDWDPGAIVNLREVV
ncbi:hypothetical protein KXR83_05770 [Williamsia muralis]|uniref:hypothetical protein n=1 Tax=Williamsia marianensis TaxID=85044 RepID=UPI003F166E90